MQSSIGLIKDKIKTDENSLDADEIPALVAFRCTFLLFFFTVLLSWNTYGWRNAGVNHILIFEIDPRNHLNYLQLLTVRPTLNLGHACSNCSNRFCMM